MTDDEPVLAAAMGLEHNIPRTTIYWHCNNPAGMLFGIAYKPGREWMIPRSAVGPFVEWYRENRKGKRGKS